MSKERRTLHFLIALLLAMTLMQATVSARTVDFAVHASADRVPLYEAFFDAFTEKTGIEVNFIQMPNSQLSKWEQIITRVAGGVSPDLVGAVSVEFVQYAAQGLLQPFDPYLLMDNASMDGLVPSLVDALQWQNQQYVMPYGASGVALAYNRRLFDESGLAYPPSAWGEADWTWETYVDALRTLTQRDGEGNALQFGLAGPPWDSWFTLPYTWGGDWIDSNLEQFAGNETEALVALQAMQDLRWEYEVMPYSGESGGGGSGFLAGTAATAGIGTWFLPATIASAEPLALMPWFRVDDHPLKGPINPIGIVMLSSAPNPLEAWEFVKFATMDPVGNYLYARAAGALPGSIGEAQQQWIQEITDQDENINPMVFLQQVAEHPGIGNIRKMTTFNDIHRVMAAAVNDVLENKASPQAAMDEAAPVIQMLIDMSEH